jgi:hypothetical protein
MGQHSGMSRERRALRSRPLGGHDVIYRAGLTRSLRPREPRCSRACETRGTTSSRRRAVAASESSMFTLTTTACMLASLGVSIRPQETKRLVTSEPPEPHAENLCGALAEAVTIQPHGRCPRVRMTIPRRDCTAGWASVRECHPTRVRRGFLAAETVRRITQWFLPLGRS